MKNKLTLSCPADAPPLYLLLFHGLWLSGPFLLIIHTFLSKTLNVYVNLFIWSHDIYSSVHPGDVSSSVALLKVSSLFSTSFS